MASKNKTTASMAPTADRRGLTPVVIGIVAGIALLLAGVATYLLTHRATPGTSGKPALTEKQIKADPAGSLDALTVTSPEFDISTSPLGQLDATSLNLKVPELASTGLVGAVTVDSDLGYTGKIEISSPTVALDVPTAAAPTSPTAPTTPSGGQTGSSGQSTDCTQFSSVPSCSYVGAPGSAGYSLCKECYPDK